MEIINVQIKDIHMDEDFNCRGHIAPMDVVDLAKDIERRGLLQPVVVQPYSDDDAIKYGKKYRLLAGFRRTTAHKVLARDNTKFNTIPCTIHEPVSEAEACFLNLAENVNRSDLTILQEAKALEKLKALSVTEADCGLHLGKSRGWVQVRYMLLGLPNEVQQEVAAGFINQTQIRELYAIYGTAGQDACFRAVRDIKDAKIRGKSISVNPSKHNKNAKRQRSRAEIQGMLSHVHDTFGHSLTTRALAWASGEISDNDLYTTLRTEAEKAGKIYLIPR